MHNTNKTESFLLEFVQTLTTKYPSNIDFILLWGSVVFGKFKPDKSDVDLLIQVKNYHDIENIRNYATKLFWKLDQKHFIQVCKFHSTKGNVNSTDVFRTNSSSSPPFIIIGPNDIRWAEGSVLPPSSDIFAFFDPIHQFSKQLSASIKRTGKVLYGRNIINEIGSKESYLSKLRNILLPYGFFISLLVIPLCFIVPNKALKHSAKNAFYSLETQLMVLEIPKITGASKELLLSIASSNNYSVHLAKRACHLQENFQNICSKWSYIDKIAFCLQAPLIICYNSLLTLNKFIQHY
ncbi:nucleotidyltransferase domain-containing protein [Patescibacteria group bacterium]|nr:nucleotidyltransferase domain-containing protein [Patescibacteria group bacterium]